jgi:hypothetical protein
LPCSGSVPPDGRQPCLRCVPGAGRCGANHAGIGPGPQIGDRGHIPASRSGPDLAGRGSGGLSRRRSALIGRAIWHSLALVGADLFLDLRSLEPDVLPLRYSPAWGVRCTAQMGRARHLAPVRSTVPGNPVPYPMISVETLRLGEPCAKTNSNRGVAAPGQAQTAATSKTVRSKPARTLRAETGRSRRAEHCGFFAGRAGTDVSVERGEKATISGTRPQQCPAAPATAAVL